ncbi:MAG: hypothetical protein ACE5JD_06635 [Candidatus Methylomirabilia bacterium]
MDYGTLVGLLLSLVVLGAASETNPKTGPPCPEGIHRLPAAESPSQGRQHQAHALPHRQRGRVLRTSDGLEECGKVVQSD